MPLITNVFKIGFFGSFYYKNFKKKSGILVAFGTADFIYRKKIEKIFYDNLKKEKYSNLKFYLEESLFNKLKKFHNFEQASFKKKMFKKISVAIIKPGFEIIQNCLRYGIVPLVFDKNLNTEFKHNARIIKLNKLGFYSNNINKLINLSIKISNNSKEQNIAYKKFKKLKWHGEKQILKNLL